MMKTFTKILIALGLLAIVLLGGLYYQSTIPRQPGVFVLRMAEFFLIGENNVQNPNLGVKVGTHVTITLQNQGGQEHKFRILSVEVYDEFLRAWRRGERRDDPPPAFDGAAIDGVPPRETRTVSFIADKPGTYVYACFERNPDLHANLGMRGNLIVEEATGLSIGPADIGVVQVNAFQIISIESPTRMNPSLRISALNPPL